MAKRGTIQEIADAMQVNQATVRRALRAEGLAAGRGGYDFDAAVAAVKVHADKDRLLGHAASGRGDGGDAKVSPYAEAKTQSEMQRARKLQIENEIAEGRLVSREAVTETGVNIIATARTALLAVGTRVAAKLADETDLTKIARTIENEVRAVLGALADDQAFFAALEAEVLS